MNILRKTKSKMGWRAYGVIGLTIGIGIASSLFAVNQNLSGATWSQPFGTGTVLAQAADNPSSAPQTWAFEETFDGDPASPSQALLPQTLDYVVTHRTHPKEQFTKEYKLYPAHHNEHCDGPNPEISPLPHHMVRAVQDSSGTDPDDSFYICKNHMMSSMGEVESYSVSSFWPRQEFDFSDGGILEFEVSVKLGHKERSWWEVLIAPRDKLKVAAAPPFPEAAIDETYPTEHIVLDFRRLIRRIRVGTGELAPNGWIVDERERGQYDWRYWNTAQPDDPALTDARQRRKMRIRIEQNQITWAIETKDAGVFDEFSVDVPGGLPFDRGLVIFKTHAYTPEKDENYDTYTFHWDNIRFDGPVVGKYDAYEADNVVYLQRNGDRPIGDTETVNITLPSVGNNPVLFGQVNKPTKGQVLLSINGRPNIEVEPYDYARPGCISDFWKSFRVPLDPSWIQAGVNTFKWTVGPSNPCATGEYDWDGFSIKSLEIQMDQGTSNPQPTATQVPVEPTTTAAPATATPPASTPEPNEPGITVQLFVDDNGNGLRDSGEEPLAGVTISIDGNAAVSSGVTDENGEYRFPTGGTESFSIAIPIPPILANRASGIRLSSLDSAEDIDFTVVNSPEGDGTATLPDGASSILLPLIVQ